MATLAESLLRDLAEYPRDRAVVLALHGHLGAGKTALVQEIAAHLGVREHVTSPTFVLMKSYTAEHPAFARLVHVDAYRIASESELEKLGFRDILARGKTLVCVEWPERIPGLLPSTALHLSLEAKHPDARDIARL